MVCAVLKKLADYGSWQFPSSHSSDHAILTSTRTKEIRCNNENVDSCKKQTYKQTYTKQFAVTSYLVDGPEQVQISIWQYVEDSRPEWCISTIYYAWDAPLCLSQKQQNIATCLKAAKICAWSVPVNPEDYNFYAKKVTNIGRAIVSVVTTKEVKVKQRVLFFWGGGGGGKKMKKERRTQRRLARENRTQSAALSTFPPPPPPLPRALQSTVCGNSIVNLIFPLFFGT